MHTSMPASAAAFITSARLSSNNEKRRLQIDVAARERDHRLITLPNRFPRSRPPRAPLHRDIERHPLRISLGKVRRGSAAPHVNRT